MHWHLAYVQLGVHQYTQVLPYRAAFWLVSPQCVLLPEGYFSPDAVLAFPFVEFHEVPYCPALQPVEVPRDDSTTVWCISHCSQYSITFGLTEGTLSQCPDH